MTKEELQQENIKKDLKIKEYKEQDEGARKEFAKAFGWGKREKTMYDLEKEWEWDNPSWAQIFIEIGKLQAARTFYDLEGNVSELECDFKEFKERLEPTLN